MAIDLSKVRYVPEESAVTPAAGRAIVGCWWVVHPEHGLAFYAGHGFCSPQCNSDPRVAERIAGQLYPGHEVRHYPVVFAGHVGQEDLS